MNYVKCLNYQPFSSKSLTVSLKISKSGEPPNLLKVEFNEGMLITNLCCVIVTSSDWAAKFCSFLTLRNLSLFDRDPAGVANFVSEILYLVLAKDFGN